MKSILKNSKGNAVSTNGKLLALSEKNVKPNGNIEGVYVENLVDDGKLITIYNPEAKATEISISGAENIWVGLNGTNCRYDFSSAEGNIIIEDFNEREAPCTYVVDNLAAENIKSGVTILGHTGTYEGEGDSTNTLKKLLDATKSGYYLFYNYKGTSVDDLISYSDTENVVSTNSMFRSCEIIQTIPLLDTSKVTKMGYMFTNCASLQSIPELNTSNVTSMASMFNGCSNLQTIPQLDTSNVADMGYMFNDCTNLQTIPELDTSKVTSMNSMFGSCQNLQTIPLLNTNNVTKMSDMFSGCQNLQTIDITSLDKVTLSSNMNNTFSNCVILTKLIIRNMTVIPPLNSNSFNNCYHFTGTVDATYNPDGLKDGRIYVPDDKVEELKVATNWSVYADIIVPLSTLQEE